MTTSSFESRSPTVKANNKADTNNHSRNKSSPPSATPYTPFSPFKKSRARTSKNNIIASISTSDSIASLYSSTNPTTGTPSSSPNTNTSNGHYYHKGTTNDFHKTKMMNNKNNNNQHIFPTNISSKSEIVLSPDGNSIQLAPIKPPVLSPKKQILSDSTTISPIFRNDIRQEWIDAMFGVHFFPKKNIHNNTSSNVNEYYTPPRQGVGSANIPSYLSYTATIPSTKDVPKSNNDKVGLTLSRIPIGVYVRLVDIESEAYAAGIVPGSVLIDINGMGVLGEPSHKLLERIWKFEGHFDEYHDIGNNSDHGGSGGFDSRKNNPKLKDGINDSNHDVGAGGGGRHKSVITLKLIKDGIIYSALLMSGTPMGVSWAPCGNFALVQRTYAMAQKAGVRRGCIVAAVNDKSLRQMNHLDTAMYLKDQFEKGVAIRVVFVYTPAASRTGYHERKNANAPRAKSNEVRTIDGVRIRKVSLAAKKKEKPMEYGVGSFFSCGTGINYQPNSADTSLSDFDVVMEIANRVAAGEIAAPTGFRGGASMKRNDNDVLNFTKLVSEYMAETNSIQESPQKDFVVKTNSGGPVAFPKLSWMDLFPSWDGLESIVFCLGMHVADYCEEIFHDMGGIVGSAEKITNTANKSSSVEANIRKIPLHSKEANTRLISAFGSYRNGEAFHMYLLQLVAFISSRELFERTVAELLTQHASEIESLSGAKEKELLKKLNADAKMKTELILEDIVQAIVSVVSFVVVLSDDLILMTDFFCCFKFNV